MTATTRPAWHRTCRRLLTGRYVLAAAAVFVVVWCAAEAVNVMVTR